MTNTFYLVEFGLNLFFKQERKIKDLVFFSQEIVEYEIKNKFICCAQSVGRRQQKLSTSIILLLTPNNSYERRGWKLF